jgi:hypothetical protein
MKNRPLLLVLVSLALGVLVYLDQWGGESPKVGAPSVGVADGGGEGAAPAARTAAAGARRTSGADAMQDPGPGLEKLTNPLALFDKSQLTDWVDRPLFAPSRKRPPVVKVAAAAPSRPARPLAPPPSYDLLGIVREGDRAIALLRKQTDGTSFRVVVGDMIDGWRVARLDAAAVLLEREDGISHTVPLTGDGDQ